MILVLSSVNEMCFGKLGQAIVAAYDGRDGLREFEKRFEAAAREGILTSIGALHDGQSEVDRRRKTAWAAFNDQHMHLRKWERRLKRAEARSMASPTKES